MARLGIVYAAKARKDIDKLVRETALTWGRKQALVYAEQLEKALSHLRDYPESGPPEPLLRKGRRIYHFAMHTIVYSIRGEDLYVARILHQNMSLTKNT